MERTSAKGTVVSIDKHTTKDGTRTYHSTIINDGTADIKYLVFDEQAASKLKESVGKPIEFVWNWNKTNDARFLHIGTIPGGGKSKNEYAVAYRNTREFALYEAANKEAGIAYSYGKDTVLRLIEMGLLTIDPTAKNSVIMDAVDKFAESYQAGISRMTAKIMKGGSRS